MSDTKEDKREGEIPEEEYLQVGNTRRLSPVQRRFIKAYQESKGNPYKACQTAKIGYHQYYSWKSESRDFVLALEAVADFWKEVHKAQIRDMISDPGLVAQVGPGAVLGLMKSLDPSLDPPYRRELVRQEKIDERLTKLATLGANKPQEQRLPSPFTVDAEEITRDIIETTAESSDPLDD